MMGVAVIMIVAENPGRYAIYDQTYNRNKNSAVERNGNRIHKTVDAFDHHKKCESSQKYGTGESPQCIHLAGAKTKAGVGSVLPGVRVCERSNTQRRRMRAHVQAVSKQSHGAIH